MYPGGGVTYLTYFLGVIFYFEGVLCQGVFAIKSNEVLKLSDFHTTINKHMHGCNYSHV